MDIAEEVRSLTLDLRAFSPSRAEPSFSSRELFIPSRSTDSRPSAPSESKKTSRDSTVSISEPIVDLRLVWLFIAASCSEISFRTSPFSVSTLVFSAFHSSLASSTAASLFFSLASCLSNFAVTSAMALECMVRVPRIDSRECFAAERRDSSRDISSSTSARFCTALAFRDSASIVCSPMVELSSSLSSTTFFSSLRRCFSSIARRFTSASKRFDVAENLSSSCPPSVTVKFSTSSLTPSRPFLTSLNPKTTSSLISSLLPCNFFPCSTSSFISSSFPFSVSLTSSILLERRCAASKSSFSAASSCWDSTEESDNFRESMSANNETLADWMEEREERMPLERSEDAMAYSLNWRVKD
mmetsp:Transcript_25972/g.48990  ORF Transcript_25972/g.48990 Transcript_25972/m.48990 type:complete len:357 (+) Transcript_25972:344-1414(+)